MRFEGEVAYTITLRQYFVVNHCTYNVSKFDSPRNAPLSIRDKRFLERSLKRKIVIVCKFHGRVTMFIYIQPKHGVLILQPQRR